MPIRLKCIVLGSSSAGKTSILRRYFHRTFEHRYRASTIGGDFYSRWIPNPLSNVADDDYLEVNKENEVTTTDSVGAERRRIDEHGRCIDGDDDCNKECDTKKTKKKKKSKKKSSPSSRSNDISKESKKKKKTSESHQKIRSGRKSTEGAEATSPSSTPQRKRRKRQRRRETSTAAAQKQPCPQVALQMWDTAGRERLASTCSFGLTSSLGDRFFDGVDAVILVYDATSTPSFLQLIRWHSEVMERIKFAHDGGAHTSSAGAVGGDAGATGNSHVWITIVANKLDQLKQMNHGDRPFGRQHQPQRDILGLRGKRFNGQDSHYEYTVKPTTTTSTSNNSKKSNPSRLKYYSGGTLQTLSYGPGERDHLWSTDSTYLNCIKQAEDCCLPDRNMVQLWCRRNGLHFVEVSALDGTGVDYAIESTVEMALKRMMATRKTETDQTLDGTVSSGEREYYEWRERKVDLYERYGREDNCFQLASCFVGMRLWRWSWRCPWRWKWW